MNSPFIRLLCRSTSNWSQLTKKPLPGQSLNKERKRERGGFMEGGLTEEEKGEDDGRNEGG